MKKLIIVIMLVGVAYAAKQYNLETVDHVSIHGTENYQDLSTGLYHVLKFDVSGAALGDATKHGSVSKLVGVGQATPFTKKEIYTTLQAKAPALAALYKTLHTELIAEDVSL